jgi:hypothetical protein
LPSESRQCLDDAGWRQLSRIAPGRREDAAWFIAENGQGGEPRLFVFEASPATIQDVVGNSHGFEYVIVSQHMDWLLAENHHGYIIAVGSPAIERLRTAFE